jgi:hypothetical protein
MLFGAQRHFHQIFSYIMMTSFSGGRILFCNLQSRVRNHTVLVIGLYELLGNPTT